jgi:hypothetical protein
MEQPEEQQQIQQRHEEDKEEISQCIMCENDAFLMDILNKKIFCSKRCQIAYYEIENIQNGEENKQKDNTYRKK